MTAAISLEEQVAAEREPTLEQRVLMICHPNMVTHQQQPAVKVRPWWYAADWDEDVVWHLEQGQVVVLEVLPDELSGVLTSACYALAGEVLAKYDEKTNRLYLRHAAKQG